MDIHRVLIKPTITEKSTLLQESGKYTFRVAKEANKVEVKQAVETNFNVTVLDVNITKLKGKQKRYGPRFSKMPDIKKAVVTLKSGEPNQPGGRAVAHALRTRIDLMPLKDLRPMTPGTRNAVRPSFEEITRTKPEKSLISPKANHAGRNNRGRITTRSRGGGSRRMYRLVDFKRRKDGVPGKIASIEYDPNRTTRIALVHYVDGEKSYILAPIGLSTGDMVESGPQAEIQPGNCLPLQNIPTGTVVHNIELTPNRGGQMVRSAGAGAQVLSREGAHVLIRLPSGEMRRFLLVCRASVGQLSQPGPQERKSRKGRRKPA